MIFRGYSVENRSGVPEETADDSPGRKPGVSEKKILYRAAACPGSPADAVVAAAGVAGQSAAQRAQRQKQKCIFSTRSAFAARWPSAERYQISFICTPRVPQPRG